MTMANFLVKPAVVGGIVVSIDENPGSSERSAAAGSRRRE